MGIKEPGTCELILISRAQRTHTYENRAPIPDWGLQGGAFVRKLHAEDSADAVIFTTSAEATGIIGPESKTVVTVRVESHELPQLIRDLQAIQTAQQKRKAEQAARAAGNKETKEV